MSGSILVTGAQGFLGRYVVAELLQDGFDVVGIGRSELRPDHFTHPLPTRSGVRLAPLPSCLAEAVRGMHYEQVDLADADATAAVMNTTKPTRVIHLAGALRDEAWPTLLSGNVTATINLCQAAASISPPPEILLGSSGSVYGDQPPGPIAETAVPEPVGAYAATKLMSEISARVALQGTGASLSIARVFNLLGPGLQPRHLASDVAHALAGIEAGLRSPVLELGDLTPVRDFIDVRDAACILARWPRRLEGQVVNVASGVGVCVHTLVAQLLAVSSCSIQLIQNESHNRIGSPVSQADTCLIGHANMFSLDKSLLDMLDYARAAQN